MTKRAIFKLGIAVIACVGAVLLIPGPRHIICGFIRGESFYRGMPSSYWSANIRQYFDAKESGSFPEIEPVTRSEVEWLDALKENTGLGTPSYRRYSPPFPSAENNTKVIPLLIDLLKDSDPRVRIWVVGELQLLGLKAKAVVPALIDVLDDNGVHRWMSGDLTVGQAAAKALVWIDPETAAKIGIKGDPKEIPYLISMLKLRDTRVRLHSARRLYHLSYVVDTIEMAEAVPALIEVLEDYSADQEWDEYTVGELASFALKRIDPLAAASAARKERR